MQSYNFVVVSLRLDSFPDICLRLHHVLHDHLEILQVLLDENELGLSIDLSRLEDIEVLGVIQTQQLLY